MSLQDLTYEINYNTDESGLSKSVQLINNMESSLDNFVKKVDYLGNTISKVNTSMSELNKSTSNANVDNLSSSLKNATNNSKELSSSTERLDRLTQVVNKSVDEYNTKIDESSNLAQQLNNRTVELSKPLQEHYEDQQKLNDEIYKSVSEEDNLANSANKVTENTKKSASSANELKNSLSGVRTVSSGISSILGAWGVVGIGYSLVSGIKSAIGAFSDFQQEMANVHATLGQVTDSDLTKLSNDAISLSSKWAISAKDIGSGMQDLASHGLNAKQIMDTIQPAVLIAVDGNIKMKDATLDLTSAIRNFNLNMEQSGSHVANVYAKAAADTAADVSNIATAMSYISPIAGQAGWSIENVSAAIGLLGDKGVLGSRAGTGLREMFTRLIKPTKDASKEMQALGFQAIDPTTHKMKDIGTLVGDLQKSLGGLNSAQKENALATIFGQQALTPVSALLQTSKQAIDNETNSLKNSDGAAYNMAITMNDTLGKAFEKFKINIQNAFITNIDRTELGYSLKEFVVSMNKNMPAISSEIGKLLDTAVRTGSGIKHNWDGISSIVLGIASSFIVLKGAMKIDAAITALGGLKKALPTVEMAGGIGLVATGFSEIHDGNKGLGDLLIATGIGMTAASKGVKALDSTSIGLVAYAFIEMNQGNTGLGALLIATGAGLEALNKHLNRSATIILLGTAFGEIKEGNRGLGALLIGTAIGFAAIEVVTMPVALMIGLVAGAIAYVVIECQTVKGAWANTWLSIKETTMEFVNPIIDKINSLITLLDKLPGVNIGKLSDIKINSDDIKMAQSLGIPPDQIQKMSSAGGGNAVQSFKPTSGTQALTNMVTSNSNVYNWLPKTKYASGTDYSKSGTALVGEKGPEIVNLPQGSQVINAQQTTKALGSNNKSMGSGVASSQNSLNSSTKKLLAENKAIVMDYVNKQTLYGQNSVKNFSTAVLEKEPLATVATTKVSTDNKNIMSLMANSGLTYGTEMVTELGQGVKDSEGNLITIVNDLATKVVNQFKTTFGIASPSKVMYQIGDFLGQGLINGLQSNDINSFITKWIGDTSTLTQNGMGDVMGQILQPMFAKGDNKDIISMVYAMIHGGTGGSLEGLFSSGAMSGNVSEWLTAALALTGTPVSWLPGLLKLVQAESGGDPTAVNSQGVGGEHATGLLQTLPSTFAEYAVAGLGNIMNPIANAAAAINYIKKTYGSVFNTPLFRGGTYVGYATGTNNATPGIHLVGEKGPELVWMKGGEHVTPNSELSSIRQQPYAGGSTSIKSETNPNISINIYESKDPRATAQEVYKVLKQHFGDLFDEKMGTIKLQMGL